MELPRQEKTWGYIIDDTLQQLRSDDDDIEKRAETIQKLEGTTVKADTSDVSIG